MSKKLLIITGDHSGDLHGANLVKFLKEIDPQIEIFGLGGEKMEQAGVKLLYNLVELSIVGFWEVIEKFLGLSYAFGEAKKFLKKEKPVLLLIDYPGFNLQIAKFAKRLGLLVIYYIAPQVWAWWKRRIKKIVRLVDKMIVVLPFEEELYRKEGMDVTFVGHPLLDMIDFEGDKNQIYKRYDLNPAKLTVGLMPGSRRLEIYYLLPVMLKACQIIAQKVPDVQFVLPLASSIKENFIKKYLKNCPLNILVTSDEKYHLRKIMNMAIVASGTATLESACFGTPMIIVYKSSPLSYFLSKLLVKIPYIGLPNIIMDEKIVPECIQEKVNPEEIALLSCMWLRTPPFLEIIQSKLLKVKTRLGKPGVSQRVAKIVYSIVSNQGKI